MQSTFVLLVCRLARNFFQRKYVYMSRRPVRALVPNTSSLLSTPTTTNKILQKRPISLEKIVHRLVNSTTNSRQKPAQNSSHRLPHLVGSASTTPPPTQPLPTSLVAIVHSVFSTFSLFNFVLDGHNLEKIYLSYFRVTRPNVVMATSKYVFFVHHPLSRPTRKSTRGRCDVRKKLHV